MYSLETEYSGLILGAVARTGWVQCLESGYTAYILGAVPRKLVHSLESGCSA